MIDPVVRDATADDRPVLAELSTEARASLVDVRGGARWLDEHPDPFTSVSTVDHTTLVASIDEVIVGYLIADTTPPIATIGEVYVIPPARELGFGDALLATTIEIARQRGCTHLEAEALPGDRETKNLYERAGIKARLITVSTSL